MSSSVFHQKCMKKSHPKLFQIMKMQATVYECRECTFKTAYVSSLQIHMQSQHEGNVFQCQYCGHEAKGKVNHKRHMKAMHEAKSLECEYCKYRTTRKDNLRAHI